MTPDTEPEPTGGKWLRRAPPWALLIGAVIASCAASLVVAGDFELFDAVSLKSVGLHYDVLKRAVTDNFALAILLYIAGYAVFGLFLLPGSPLFVVAGGLVFGTLIGAPLSLFASTLAATLAFVIARRIVGGRAATVAHPRFQKLRDGFGRHALGYMMFLRLTPGVPFAAVNVLPALIGVPLSTFVAGTLVGLLPSRLALSTAGAGLGDVIDRQNTLYSQCLAKVGAALQECPYEITMGSLLTRETLVAFVALSVLSLVSAIIDVAPRLWQRLRGRDRAS